MQEVYDQQETAKIIVMGNQHVGKTSIIKAYLEGQSQKNMTHVTNTIQDFYKQISVERSDGTTTDLKLKIWDAAGDNNIHNLASLYTRDVQCGILVFAINSEKSFNEIEEWHKHIKQQNNKIVLMLVGNKSDLSQGRAVAYDFAVMKAQELGCSKYVETSAWTDVDSINGLFETIAQEIVK